MRAELINPFLDATMNLLNNMLGELPNPGNLVLVKNFSSHRWTISGIISLTGESNGVIAIRMSELLTRQLLKKSGLEWKDKEEENNLINEMVGEMINVVAGNAISALDKYDLDISVPLIIQGPNHSIAWPGDTPVVAIPFATTAGPLEINVSLKDLPI